MPGRGRTLDFVGPRAMIDSTRGCPTKNVMVARGPTKSSVRLRSGIQCDLRAVSAAEYPFALNYFTGSKEHNIEMRNRALKRGWTLNEYRLAPVPISSGERKKKSIVKIL